RALVLLSAALAACGSAELPQERWYRLQPPAPQAEVEGHAGVVRVGDLRLAGHLGGDRLLVALSPVRVAAYELHRWAGPLEQLLADALVSGLRRTGCFTRVKTGIDPGGEDLLLTGRVLDFQQAPDADGGWCGLVTLDFELVDRDGMPLLQGEVQARTPLEAQGPEALVAALSRSVTEVIEGFVRRCAGAGVFGAAVAGPAR